MRTIANVLRSDAAGESAGWRTEFTMHSAVEFDFVISQGAGWPIGMMRSSPAEFRRRVLAAGVSYQLTLNSIDYTKRRYVPSGLYEKDKVNLGDSISDYLKESLLILKAELKELHTRGEPPFGVLAAELSLFKLPETLDLARMTANRGHFLEVLPILRLCLEMISWAAQAYQTTEDDKVSLLKAQSSVSKFKHIYASAGRVYGYLSKFAHWDFDIHLHFLRFEDGTATVIAASCKYRAMSLALCLLVLDMTVAAVRHLYKGRSKQLVKRIQRAQQGAKKRQVRRYMDRIASFSDSSEIREICRLFS